MWIWIWPEARYWFQILPAFETWWRSSTSTLRSQKNIIKSYSELTTWHFSPWSPGTTGTCETPGNWGTWGTSGTQGTWGTWGGPSAQTTCQARTWSRRLVLLRILNHQMEGDLKMGKHKLLEGTKPTLWDVDSERASGNLLPRKGHVDGVRPLQHRDVGTPKNAIALILQDNLHCVPPPVGVHDHDANISGPSPWWNHKEREDAKENWWTSWWISAYKNLKKETLSFLLLWLFLI